MMETMDINYCSDNRDIYEMMYSNYKKSLKDENFKMEWGNESSSFSDKTLIMDDFNESILFNKTFDNYNNNSNNNSNLIDFYSTKNSNIIKSKNNLESSEDDDSENDQCELNRQRTLINRKNSSIMSIGKNKMEAEAYQKKSDSHIKNSLQKIDLSLINNENNDNNDNKKCNDYINNNNNEKFNHYIDDNNNDEDNDESDDYINNNNILFIPESIEKKLCLSPLKSKLIIHTTNTANTINTSNTINSSNSINTSNTINTTNTTNKPTHKKCKSDGAYIVMKNKGNIHKNGGGGEQEEDSIKKMKDRFSSENENKKPRQGSLRRSGCTDYPPVPPRGVSRVHMKELMRKHVKSESIDKLNKFSGYGYPFDIFNSNNRYNNKSLSIQNFSSNDDFNTFLKRKYRENKIKILYRTSYYMKEMDDTDYNEYDKELFDEQLFINVEKNETDCSEKSTTATATATATTTANANATDNVNATSSSSSSSTSSTTTTTTTTTITTTTTTTSTSTTSTTTNNNNTPKKPSSEPENNSLKFPFNILQNNEMSPNIISKRYQELVERIRKNLKERKLMEQARIEEEKRKKLIEITGPGFYANKKDEKEKIKVNANANVNANVKVKEKEEKKVKKMSRRQGIIIDLDDVLYPLFSPSAHNSMRSTSSSSNSSTTSATYSVASKNTLSSISSSSSSSTSTYTSTSTSTSSSATANIPTTTNTPITTSSSKESNNNLNYSTRTSSFNPPPRRYFHVNRINDTHNSSKHHLASKSLNDLKEYTTKSNIRRNTSISSKTSLSTSTLPPKTTSTPSEKYTSSKDYYHDQHNSRNTNSSPSTINNSCLIKQYYPYQVPTVHDYYHQIQKIQGTTTTTTTTTTSSKDKDNVKDFDPQLKSKAISENINNVDFTNYYNYNNNYNLPYTSGIDFHSYY